MSIRVVIAEDAVLFRAGLVRLLEDRGHQVCAEAADGGALLDAVARWRPDVAVVDVRMPPTHTDEGLRAALRLRSEYPGTGVLVLSQFAGAAKQLDAALLVNPHDLDAMARAIKIALAMPLDERLSRWTAMMGALEASSLTNWFGNYVAALKATGAERRGRERRNVAWPSFRRLQIEPAASPAY